MFKGVFRNKEIANYLKPGKHVHLVGIGGVSMRPLGLVLKGMGMEVTGSDMSGSNGTRIAGVALVTEAGQNVVIHQKTSQPTQLSADEVILQSKQDRGMPYVMALMDDTVTGVSLA